MTIHYPAMAGRRTVHSYRLPKGNLYKSSVLTAVLLAGFMGCLKTENPSVYGSAKVM